MRKVIYWVHTSIDGHIEGPDGEFDWPSMGPELSAYSIALSREAGAFLYGRKVWEMMSGFWPHVESISDDPHDLAFAPIWRETPKIVFSRTLERADGDTRVIGEDIAGELTALKRRPGKDLLLNGGSCLAAALAELDLIDDYRIVVHPVVLGGGKPLFPGLKDRLGFELVETRTFDSRTVMLRYGRTGRGSEARGQEPVGDRR
ncbi:dihydrofolate reductase family protein [Planobispora siamensis]|uniref:Deaminase n=1 Tax=Planobispora siamensis TaxID=936338 RepID=A0A8J3WPE4_9ACTN|nr:dihydrofolate reductase family protein [Planobispora siamensis]GIH95582.1 deaminase [Planobispora siamensis]